MTWSRSLFEREKSPLLVWISKNEVATNSSVISCGSSIKQQLLWTFGGFGEKKWYISKISRINAVFCAFYILLDLRRPAVGLFTNRGVGIPNLGNCRTLQVQGNVSNNDQWSYFKTHQNIIDHARTFKGYAMITPFTIGILILDTLK